LLDTDLRRYPAASGIVLTDYLGRFLGVKTGDRVIVEVLDGAKPIREVPVVGLAKLYLG